MDTLTAIATRRSIRKYTSEPVPEELITSLLRAAMMAPSAGNQQAWHFVVITDRERLQRITSIHPYVGMAAKAPLAILVCGDESREKFPGYWPQDCSAAMQNLLLAAHAQGLGAVWTGVYPMAERIEGFKDTFSLPDKVIPLGLAVIGWPAQKLPSRDRFNPERVHRDRW